MLFVTADTHFNHQGALRHMPESRPYESVTEMNEAIIGAWNQAVLPTDDVWILGDFAFKPRADGTRGEPIEAIFERLNGHKSLVVGNHDEEYPAIFALPWEHTEVIATLRENGRKAIACHYPMATWRNAHKGYIHLHGHCHGNLTLHDTRRFDVGWDLYRRPMPLHTIFEAADLSGPYTPVDHHKEKADG